VDKTFKRLLNVNMQYGGQ